MRVFTSVYQYSSNCLYRFKIDNRRWNT